MLTFQENHVQLSVSALALALMGLTTIMKKTLRACSHYIHAFNKSQPWGPVLPEDAVQSS